MTTPAGNNGGAETSAVVVASVTLIVVVAIAAVAFLVYEGKETQAILSILSVLSPFIVGILAARTSRKVESVKQQVDGKISNLITDKANLEHQVSVAGLTPITTTVAFDPDTNTHPGIPTVGKDTPETNPPTNPYHVADLMRRLAAEKEQDSKHG